MKKEQVLLSPEKFQVAARLLKVIAHPVKLEILQVLKGNEQLDVTSLCARLGADCEISMMSHHLAKMKDNGILKSEKSGKQVFYMIADKSILGILKCINNCDLI